MKKEFAHELHELFLRSQASTKDTRIKTLRFLSSFAFFALNFLLFTGCNDNLSLPQISITEGYGLVSISFTNIAAKTIKPDPVFDSYEYTFTPVAGGDSLILPPDENNMFALKVGEWKVEVKAFVNGVTAPVATGVSGNFTVSDTGVTSVKVEFTSTLTGTGSFSYNISFPADAELKLRMENLIGSPGTIVINDEVFTGGSASGTLPAVPAGSYAIILLFTKEGQYGGIAEAVHIYPNLQTEYGTSEKPKPFTNSVFLNEIVLQLEIPPEIKTLSPIDTEAVFQIKLKGFYDESHSNGVTLSITAPPAGITVNGETTAVNITSGSYNSTDDSYNFTVTAAYNGTTAFSTKPAGLTVSVNSLPYTYNASNGTLSFDVADGVTDFLDAPGEYDRRIPVHTGNIVDFNSYANTASGLSKNYKLIESINATNAPVLNNWTPIGAASITNSIIDSNSPAFTGSFNGMENTIYGLNINTDNANAGTGFFGYIHDGTVKNLNLVDVNIDGYEHVGSVVGLSVNSTVENCTVEEGNVSGSISVGGVVGWNQNTIVKNSSYNGNVTGTTRNIGGIVGCNFSKGIVENCNSNGNITGTGTCLHVGGVVGTNDDSTVTNSWNEGELVSGNQNVGGVAGQNSSGTVEYCWNEGDIEGTGRVGGVAGWSNGTIKNSYNIGKIGEVKGYEGIGGVAGINSGIINSCYNEGDIFSSNGNTGGIAGTSDNTVLNCYNKGNITSGVSNIGGIVGWNNTNTTSIVENCYNIGIINGNVGGRVGGIAGFLQIGTVRNCVSLSTEVSGNTSVGRIAGESNTDLSNNNNKARSTDEGMTINPSESSADRGITVNFGSSINAVFDGWNLITNDEGHHVWSIPNTTLNQNNPLPTLQPPDGADKNSDWAVKWAQQEPVLPY